VLVRYDFDRKIERRGTNCLKWDHADWFFGTNDLLPMWVADMDFEAPGPVLEAILKRAGHGAFGYTVKPESYHEALVEWMKKRHGWEIKKEWLAHAPGVVPAVHLSIMAFSHPGDTVLVNSPVYYPFYSAVKNTGRQLLMSPLKSGEGRYEMDFEDIERRIDSRTRLFILSNPHNPVGRVWKREELERLGEICLKNDIKIVSDEIHSDLVFEGYRHVPLASISRELSMQTITCVAPSKTFNLAGLATASVIVENKRMLDEYNNALSSVGIGLANIFGIVAFEAAYRYGEEWLEQLLPYLRENFDYMREFLGKNLPAVKVTELEGTYLAWLDFRGLGMTVEELKDFLYKKARVGFEDGSVFGEEGAGFMRVNLACPRSTVEEALNRLLESYREISGPRGSA
jgi:cystathionine beta-lyase